MRIAIIGAMEEETTYIISHLEKCQKEVYRGYSFYTGINGNHEIVVTTSGVGKVAAASLLSTLLFKYQVDKVINIGIAGGIYGKVSSLEVVVGVNTAYYDVDVTTFNYKYGQVPGCPEIFAGDDELIKTAKQLDGKLGTIITGDKFVTDNDEIQKIINTYFALNDVLAVDMESAAFAQTAFLFKVPFLAIRAISDVAGEDDQENQYENRLDMATMKSSQFVLEIIKRLS